MTNNLNTLDNISSSIGHLIFADIALLDVHFFTNNK